MLQLIRPSDPVFVTISHKKIHRAQSIHSMVAKLVSSGDTVKILQSVNLKKEWVQNPTQENTYIVLVQEMWPSVTVLIIECMNCCKPRKNKNEKNRPTQNMYIDHFVSELSSTCKLYLSQSKNKVLQVEIV